MHKILKWVVPVAGGLVALLLSIAVDPTVFECKLFTDCHEISTGYALLSFFDQGTQSALSSEHAAVLIGHSVAYTLIGLVLGLLAVLGTELYLRRTQPVSFAPASSAGPAFQEPLAGPVVPRTVTPAAVACVQLTGMPGFEDYYLKVAADELARMRHGLSIGRDPASSDMVIGHESISRYHARLSARGDAFLIEDLGSTNGTKINGRSLKPDEPCALCSGDKILFGSVLFKVTIG